jgi:hypothetical protein
MAQRRYPGSITPGTKRHQGVSEPCAHDFLDVTISSESYNACCIWLSSVLVAVDMRHLLSFFGTPLGLSAQSYQSCCACNVQCQSGSVERAIVAVATQFTAPLDERSDE